MTSGRTMFPSSELHAPFPAAEAPDAVSRAGLDRERDPKRTTPALEVQVGRPLDCTPCDGSDCSSPAVVSVTLRADWAPHFYCAEHWPAMHAMLRDRDHKLTY